MKDVENILMEEARSKGICREGYESMRSRNKDALVDYYLANPDWCLERNFPDMQTLTEQFSSYAEKGVFVNKMFHGELLNDRQTYIFHNCKGTVKVGLNVEKGIIPMLYLANGCRMRVVGTGDQGQKRASIVPVYIFGKNDVSARSNKYAEFVKYKNSVTG